jgi:hypothetical protein
LRLGRGIFFILLFALGCTNQKDNALAEKLEISFAKQPNTLMVSNIDDYIINSLKEDGLVDGSLTKSFSVFVKTDDEDLQDLQKPIAGTYQLSQNSIIFIPDSSFVKGRNYLVEVYLQNPSGDVTNHLKMGSSISQNQFIQKVLTY